MGLLPDTQNYELRMRRECRDHFPRYRGLARGGGGGGGGAFRAFPAFAQPTILRIW